MKKNKAKTKKGMTLIEVIISVALLSILIMPISGMIMSSFKNNKSSEYKQQATYIGQKLLEELKSYDEITLKGEDKKKYFELLDGDKIYKDSLENNFKSEFETGLYGKENIKENKNKFKVNVNIEEDKNFTYTDINNLEENKDASFILSFTEDAGKKNVTLEQAKETKKLSGDLIIRLEKDNTLKVIDKKSGDELINFKDTINFNNKIVLFFDKSNKEKDLTNKTNNSINIELENNLESVTEVFIINEVEKLNYNYLITKGNFIVNGPMDKIEEDLLGSRFNYTVEVKNKDDINLFEGRESKNIIIK